MTFPHTVEFFELALSLKYNINHFKLVTSINMRVQSIVTKRGIDLLITTCIGLSPIHYLICSFANINNLLYCLYSELQQTQTMCELCFVLNVYYCVFLFHTSACIMEAYDEWRLDNQVDDDDSVHVSKHINDDNDENRLALGRKSTVSSTTTIIIIIIIIIILSTSSHHTNIQVI